MAFGVNHPFLLGILFVATFVLTPGPATGFIDPGLNCIGQCPIPCDQKCTHDCNDGCTGRGFKSGFCITQASLSLCCCK
ncbi:hypothetical protein AAZX31_08G347800 [Glycine max]|uniref:LCR n=2 Tax=Glycine subgen. Soja TaxID=1462606 RepID=K7LAU6_SOYBN|nr:hypothetical protein JHK87_023435 [Glycine soja]KAG5017956.1 hypothetical protein JHK85_024092 [Glycine max]KAG5138756.1 hypothetical protein JHK82_023487 [Glycine max]KAH1054704.1 hypothetical protein GYH30_023466 [Glycine max]KAH1239937.1 hypothetical protein GmHk_08G024258 [Glycine max]